MGSQDEYLRRHGILRAAPLPCGARSLTAGELRATNRRYTLWTGLLILLFVVGSGFIALRPATGPQRMDMFLIGLAGSCVLAAFLILPKLLAQRRYSDPRIRVDVGQDEVIVTGPTGRDARPYEDLAVSRLLSKSSKSGRYFVGLALHTRLGEIRLEDDYYKGGQAAAGAILKRLEERGLPLIQSR